MASPRPAIAFASLILIAGAILLILFTLIAGGVDKNPTNRFYFLEADTHDLGNAAPISRWTFWNACGVVNGRNDCGKVHPAYPFDPARNFGTRDIFGSHEYYLETRFMFAFVFIGLFFATCSLFLGVLALVSRIGSFLTSGLCSVALFFQTITAALMTAAYVQGRNDFRGAGRSARLGRYNFGFMWAAVACLLLATILFFVGGFSLGGGGGRGKNKAYTNRTGGRSFFGRRKSSKRNRGSFIDPERQRRISKDSFS